MYKMRKLNNKGSVSVELAFVVPIVLGIIVLIIYTFLDGKMEGELQCDNYTALYVESEDKIYGEVKDRLWRWQIYGDILYE